MAYVLATEPEIQEKLHEELDNAVKTRGDMPLYDFVSSLDYLDPWFQQLQEMQRVRAP